MSLPPTGSPKRGGRSRAAPSFSSLVKQIHAVQQRDDFPNRTPSPSFPKMGVGGESTSVTWLLDSQEWLAYFVGRDRTIRPSDFPADLKEQERSQC
jgi:hypothetical protein